MEFNQQTTVTIMEKEFKLPKDGSSPFATPKEIRLNADTEYHKNKASDMFDAFVSEMRGEIVSTADAQLWKTQYMGIHYQPNEDEHFEAACQNCGKGGSGVLMDYSRRWMGIDILIDLAPWIMTQRLTFTVSDSDRIPLMCLTLDATGYMNGRFPIDPGYKNYIQSNKHRHKTELAEEAANRLFW